jgi:hypothetical protein
MSCWAVRLQSLAFSVRRNNRSGKCGIDRMVQKQVLEYVSQGSSQYEIAAKLQVDKSTIIMLDQETKLFDIRNSISDPP